MSFLQLIAPALCGIAAVRVGEFLIWRSRTNRVAWGASAAMIAVAPYASFLVCREAQTKFISSRVDNNIGNEQHELKFFSLAFLVPFIFSSCIANVLMDLAEWILLLKVHSPRGRFFSARLPAAKFPHASQALHWRLFAALPITVSFLSLVWLPGSFIFCVANVISPPRPLPEADLVLLCRSYPRGFAETIVAIRGDSRHPIVWLVNSIMHLSFSGGEGALAFALFNCVFAEPRTNGASLRIAGTGGRKLLVHEVCHCRQQFHSRGVISFLCMYLAQYLSNIYNELALERRKQPASRDDRGASSTATSESGDAVEDGDEEDPIARAYLTIAAERQAFQVEEWPMAAANSDELDIDNAIDRLFFATWY